MNEKDVLKQSLPAQKIGVVHGCMEVMRDVK